MKRKKRKRKRHVTIRSFIWEVSAGQNGSTTVELQYGRKRRKAEGWTCGLQQHPIPLPTNTEVPRHARTPRTTCFWHVFVRKPGSNFHQENSADCVLVEAPQDKREKELAKEKETKKVGLCYTPCGSLRCFFTLYHEHQCEHLVRQDAETKNLIQVSDVIDQQLKKKKEATVSPYISDLNVNCVNCKTCCSDGRCYRCLFSFSDSSRRRKKKSGCASCWANAPRAKFEQSIPDSAFPMDTAERFLVKEIHLKYLRIRIWVQLTSINIGWYRMIRDNAGWYGGVLKTIAAQEPPDWTRPNRNCPYKGINAECSWGCEESLRVATGPHDRTHDLQLL